MPSGVVASSLRCFCITAATAAAMAPKKNSFLSFMSRFYASAHRVGRVSKNGSGDPWPLTLSGVMVEARVRHSDTLMRRLSSQLCWLFPQSPPYNVRVVRQGSEPGSMRPGFHIHTRSCHNSDEMVVFSHAALNVLCASTSATNRSQSSPEKNQVLHDSPDSGSKVSSHCSCS